MADNPVDELAFEIGSGLTAGATPTAIAQHLVQAGWCRPERARLHPLGGVGLIGLAAGVVAAVFVDWRWAVVGVAALVVCAAIGVATQKGASRG